MFDSVPSVYDGTGVNVKIGLLENVLLPRNQQRDKNQKKKKAPTTAEREPRIKTILPAAEK